MSVYEHERLQELRQLNLLDTPPSESFDRITRMASHLFGLPVAAVSLTDEDRQWFKSRVGTELWEIPRDRAPCSDISATTEVRVIEDLMASDYYRDSRLAQLGLRFYAGAPLMTRNGYCLGTLCVLGSEPRSASAEEIHLLEDLSAMVMAQIELQQALGRVDPTTGLPNRTQFSEDLMDLARDLPGENRFAVLAQVLDAGELDSLTRIMGPARLDQLCKQLSRELQAGLPPETTLYCLGSCQYLFLQTADNDTEVMEATVERLDSLKGPNRHVTLPFRLRPKAGVVPFQLGWTTPPDILRMACNACQDAQDKRIDAALYCETLDAAHRRRFTLVQDLERALNTESELRLVFQPRISVASGCCVGAEALLRWHHPELGHVSPREVIPLIENAPLGCELTRWVLRAALAQGAIWHQQGLDLRLSINIMASDLEDEGFANLILEELAHWNLPAESIELELTESSLVRGESSAPKELEALVNAGIRIAIDDFGTGYSSLSYLTKIPAHVVKIDRAFTSREEGVSHSAGLLEGMLTLAQDLGYRTVAEGFAPLDMFHTLKQLGCDEVQSFAIARPLPPDAFEHWLGWYKQTDSRKQTPGFSPSTMRNDAKPVSKGSLDEV